MFIGKVEGHGVADEVAGAGLEAELVVDLLHAAVVDVKALVRRGILGVEGSNPLDEGLHPALLEDAHEGRLESLASIRGNLSNGSLGARALLNVAAGDLLE